MPPLPTWKPLPAWRTPSGQTWWWKRSPRNRELKQEVSLAGWIRICPPHAILATNTSAIPISSIAAATGRPDRVVGTHFFGPVPLMRLCEIIAGVLTSRDTMDAADTWARSLGKETVRVPRDIAGFIANRVTIPASLEAVRVLEAGEASVSRSTASPAWVTPRARARSPSWTTPDWTSPSRQPWQSTKTLPTPASSRRRCFAAWWRRACAGAIGQGLLRLRERGEEGTPTDRGGGGCGRGEEDPTRPA